jgi:hypothetical protein
VRNLFANTLVALRKPGAVHPSALESTSPPGGPPMLAAKVCRPAGRVALFGVTHATQHGVIRLCYNGFTETAGSRTSLRVICRPFRLLGLWCTWIRGQFPASPPLGQRKCSQSGVSYWVSSYSELVTHHVVISGNRRRGDDLTVGQGPVIPWRRRSQCRLTASSRPSTHLAYMEEYVDGVAGACGDLGDGYAAVEHSDTAACRRSQGRPARVGRPVAA